MNPTSIDRSQVAAALLSALLITLLIFRVSDAALSATTDNTGNSFTVATIQLSDNKGAAMFNVTNMVPGQSVNDCITVTYNGQQNPDVVRVYSDGLMAEAGAGAGTLADLLTVVIEEGTVITDCSTFTGASIFTGTLTAFNAVTTYAGSTSGTFDPAADGDNQIYRITVTLAAGAGSSVAGKSINDLGFVWETVVS